MARSRVLSHEQARAFYDRFGTKQDLQGFYENAAIEVLLRHGGFESARAVVEFGCGTGRLAERLLRERLPPDATYLGFGVSRTMVALASARLRPWGNRARVQLTDGRPQLALPVGVCDRFLSTYVFDLLAEDEIRAVLRESRRLLGPAGVLCLASLTFGQTLASRAVCRLWTAIHSFSPGLVGGCRPLGLQGFTGSGWKVRHEEIVCSFCVCTEVLVAE